MAKISKHGAGKIMVDGCADTCISAFVMTLLKFLVLNNPSLW